MDNNKLIIPVNSSVALAKTSVALSITDKLTFNQNQKMVKEIFLSNNDFFIDIISRYYPLNEILLEKYESEWKEVQIVYNTNVFWSDSIVEKFIYKNFLAIEENTDTDPYPVHLESLSEALIETYLSNWNQESLSPKKIKWTEEILEKFKYNWSWFYLSENKVLPWSESFIDKYFDKWDWEKLSKNEVLPWSESFIDKYFDKWDWEELSENKVLPWSESFIEKYFDKWDWIKLSGNEALPWSESFVEKYFSKWSWRLLSQNEALPWSEGFVNKYNDRWAFDYSKNLFCITDFLVGFSINRSLPWSENFIDKYIDKWNWEYLSVNESLPWSENFIDKYIDKWNWGGLSANESLPWSEKFIDKYIDKWFWDCLIKNEFLPWSEEFINKYIVIQKVDLLDVFYNKGIKWNLRMLLNHIKHYYLGYDGHFPLNKQIWTTLKPYVDDNLIEDVFKEFGKSDEK